MADEISCNGTPTRKAGANDRRRTQLDALENNLEDKSTAGPKRSQKQAGQDLHNPQDETEAEK